MAFQQKRTEFAVFSTIGFKLDPKAKFFTTDFFGDGFVWYDTMNRFDTPELAELEVERLKKRKDNPFKKRERFKIVEVETVTTYTLVK